jgi:hypothetical protein
MAGKMGHFNYVSDDGNTYIVRLDASNAAAVGAVAASGRPNLPHGYRERHVWVTDTTDVTGGRTPTGLRRKIPVTNPAAALWVGGTDVISLPDFTVTPSVAVNWNVEGRVGEQRYAR